MMKTVVLAFTFLFYLSIQSLGQKGKEINFYLTPSIATEILNRNGVYVKDFLEKETGLSIKMKVPTSYDQLVDAFGTGNACFAMMSSQSYIVANKKYNATVKLRSVRFGHSVYYGMIVARAGAGIKTIKDINGKTIAYTDVLSTSGYLYPKNMLAKAKVKPSKEIFAKKHDAVIKMVYEGKADVGAAFYSPPASDGIGRDARERIKDKYPDVEQKVIILVKTDPIPNDPIVFSQNFDADDARKIYIALVKLTQDVKGKQTLLDLYGIEGFVKAGDADYNSLRQVMAE